MRKHLYRQRIVESYYTTETNNVNDTIYFKNKYIMPRIAFQQEFYFIKMREA